MAWSYSGDPSASDSDQVRFLVGDTLTAEQLVTDEEITWALTQGSTYTAAAVIADGIAALFSRKSDMAVDSLKNSYSQRSAQYRVLADDLRVRASSVGGLTVFAGGISVAGKESRESNTDRVEPNIKIGIDDNPLAGD